MCAELKKRKKGPGPAIPIDHGAVAFAPAIRLAQTRGLICSRLTSRTAVERRQVNLLDDGPAFVGINGKGAHLAGSRFAVVNPRLGFLKFRPERPLRQSCRFPQLSQERRNDPILRAVLGLGHWPATIRPFLLDTDSVS